MKGVNDASRAQVAAADPAQSVWVSANAGSGKTKVLTDRVARLLLDGVPPERILCLTYTKAAAANMQNRLFERLGKWAMLGEADLCGVLDDLGEPPARLTPDFLRLARTLFATALETPGGLKIQTIHAFCAGLLRRFPLEAGVSPRFSEMDERSGRSLRADILEDLADAPDSTAVEGFFHHFRGPGTDAFLLEILRHRDAFLPETDEAAILRALGLPPDHDEARYLGAVFPDWADEVFDALPALLLGGSVTDVKHARVLAASGWAERSLRAARIVEDMFVYGPGTSQPGAPKTDRFPTKALREANPAFTARLQRLMALFAEEKPRRQALAVARRTWALHRFARAFLPLFDARKAAHGWLDFDDLILGARRLLSTSHMAGWVLYKLDGGIDHILVDEAQDTSPAQWDVIAAIADEFYTGESARTGERTLFVVGDEKQSIYSFQGADPAGFSRMRRHFSGLLAGIGKPLAQSALGHSFRSSQTVLRVVDIVVRNSRDIGLSFEVDHKAFFDDMPGRVDLWPFLDKTPPPPAPDWTVPAVQMHPDHTAEVLAARIATAIRHIVKSGTVIRTRDGPRAARYADFVILLPTRSKLFGAIIGALKAAALPVAGADRLRVGGELAVRDLVAVLRFLATPEDDLSLAAALRSPLFGLGEDALYRLAHGRRGFLWQSLRDARTTHEGTLATLDDLMRVADLLRPYDMLERILVRHRGRERLIARLGTEAADGIDALLGLALGFETEEIPTLTGFLSWLDADETEIKRQADTEASEIRVMTVHAAKGLESPIVILPDTGYRRPPHWPSLQLMENGLPVWMGGKDDLPPSIGKLRDAAEDDRRRERERLFYVAMTRAESWLIVCGEGERGKDGTTWYEQSEAALAEAGAAPARFLDFEIRRLETLPWPDDAGTAGDRGAEPADAPPSWLGEAPPAAPQQPQVRSPSDLGGAKAILSPASTMGDDDTAARRHGTHVHLLLEHLPAVEPAAWPRVAANLIAASDRGASRAVVESALAEARRVLDDPALAFIFAPETLAEVPLAGTVGGTRVLGTIDRLAVGRDRVLIVDFKTNSEVPATADATPEGLLRQMGAYAAIVGDIYPGRAVETAILWTKTATLMPLCGQTVAAALARAGPP